MLNKPSVSHLQWVLAGVLPLVIFAVLMLVLFTQQQEKAMHQLLQETAHNAAGTLDRTIAEQLVLLNGLASSRSLDKRDLPAFRVDAQRLQQLHPEWQSIILTDQHQPIFNLSNSTKEPLPPTRDPVSLLKVWTTEQPNVENLVNGFVAIRIPILRDKQILNTLAVTIDPQFFLNTLLIPNNIQQRGFIITGDDQVIIAASGNAPATAGSLLPPELGHKLVKTILWQENLYAGPVHIGSGNWKVFAFAPATSIEAPFLHKRFVIFLSGLFALILTGFLVVSMSLAWASRREAVKLRYEITERK
jgi:hypothetical protein